MEEQLDLFSPRYTLKSVFERGTGVYDWSTKYNDGFREDLTSLNGVISGSTFGHMAEWVESWKFARIPITFHGRIGSPAVKRVAQFAKKVGEHYGFICTYESLAFYFYEQDEWDKHSYNRAKLLVDDFINNSCWWAHEEPHNTSLGNIVGMDNLNNNFQIVCRDRPSICFFDDKKRAEKIVNELKLVGYFSEYVVETIKGIGRKYTVYVSSGE